MRHLQDEGGDISSEEEGGGSHGKQGKRGSSARWARAADEKGEQNRFPRKEQRLVHWDGKESPKKTSMARGKHRGGRSRGQFLPMKSTKSFVPHRECRLAPFTGGQVKKADEQNRTKAARTPTVTNAFCTKTLCPKSRKGGVELSTGPSRSSQNGVLVTKSALGRSQKRQVGSCRTTRKSTLYQRLNLRRLHRQRGRFQPSYGGDPTWKGRGGGTRPKGRL